MGRANTGAFDKEKNRKEDESEKNLAELKEQYNQIKEQYNYNQKMRAHFAWLISATYPDQQEDTEGTGTSARNKEIFRIRKRDEFDA